MLIVDVKQGVQIPSHIREGRPCTCDEPNICPAADRLLKLTSLTSQPHMKS